MSNSKVNQWMQTIKFCSICHHLSGMLNHGKPELPNLFGTGGSQLCHFWQWSYWDQCQMPLFFWQWWKTNALLITTVEMLSFAWKVHILLDIDHKWIQRAPFNEYLISVSFGYLHIQFKNLLDECYLLHINASVFWSVAVSMPNTTCRPEIGG